VVARWVMSWLSASHNRYIRSFVSHPLYFSMSPNQAIPAEKSIRFSPPAAAQPLTILSCSEALKATRSRRACRMAIRRNDRPCMFDSPKQLRMVSLRQESFGKEEETRALKPFVETLRVRIPPGKAGPAARSESCVVVGRPILRSVDSEVKGCVIEPRKYKPLGAFVLDTGGGRVRQLTHGPLSLPDPAGVEEHGQ
jgi:hypothetical protein